MRILKQPDQPKPYLYGCGCGAQLEVERSDCKRVLDQRDGDYYSFTCPVCLEERAIAAKLPKGWNDGIRSKQ